MFLRNAEGPKRGLATLFGLRPAVVRYLLVGATCALSHIVYMTVFEWFGIPAVAAFAMSFTIVLVTGYLLHCAFTFRQAPAPASFLRFAGGMAANFPISLALTLLFQNVLALGAIIAGPLVILSMMAFNYAVTRWALMNGPRRVH